MQNQYFVGIDVAKRQNVATISDLKANFQTFSFSNNHCGVLELMKQISHLKNNQVILGVEATGIYHLPLCHSITNLGYKIKVINPLLTKRMAKATIRKTKTDKIDSKHIANMLKNGDGHLFCESKVITKLKTLTRHRLFLQNTIRQMKAHNETIKFRESIFTGQEKDILSSTRSETDKIVQNLEQKKQELTKQIIQMSKNIAEVQYLKSIPGISPQLAAGIYCEIGDIARFSSPSSLIAFAGIDPSVNQSGQSKNKTGKISKRGSPYLRYYLFIAAKAAVRCDKDLKQYYQKKKIEGKHYYIRLIAVSRRLLLRIHRILIDKRFYIIHKNI
ncbi:MAG: IS110 family transposase [Patescibacteria group bacterium]